MVASSPLKMRWSLLANSLSNGADRLVCAVPHYATVCMPRAAGAQHFTPSFR